MAAVRINLLPHREQKRRARQRQFVSFAVLLAILALAVVGLVHMIFAAKIEDQNARNKLLKTEIAKLDEQIKEIATLRAEIDALRARQYAVESLQANRTIPVHLMDELVKHTPEGIYLKTMRQDERKITLTGYAQSNDRVSELLRNLANRTPWLERPELVEIKASRVGGPSAPKDARRVFEFSLNALIKTTEPQQRGPAPKTTSAPATLAAAGASANR